MKHAELLFHGAAGEVTGSCHLLGLPSAEAPDGQRWVAFDYGLSFGHREEARLKNSQHPVPPDRLHAVVVSHAHIDHIGKLPRLVRDGFAGPIYMTPATRDLAAVLLADAAHVQQEDAEYLARKARRAGKPRTIEPLYTPADAVATLRLVRAVPYGQPFHVADGLRCTFSDAGHILGSATVFAEITAGSARPPLRLVYTGDIGKTGVPILRDPAPLPRCDYLICESTYGGRRTPSFDETRRRFADVVARTLAAGGKVIIPSFSVGRAQTIAYVLNDLFTSGQVPPVPVYVDSPLAIDATEVFRVHPECYDRDARLFARDNGDILGGRHLHYVRAVSESKRLHRRRRPCVIISASGMCEFGRILHHLKNNIARPRNTVLIVGYQAADTLGRRLVEGAARVRIFDRYYPVRARVEVLNGFSAHADADGLDALTAPLAPACREAFLVHGEPDQSDALRQRMLAAGFASVRTPRPGDRCPLAG